MAFDEGCVPLRSRLCPVRMFNKDKPYKFHVQLFICSGVDEYVCFNVDINQGKRGNAHKGDGLQSLPVNQRVVVQAIKNIKSYDITPTERLVVMDNR